MTYTKQTHRHIHNIWRLIKDRCRISYWVNHGPSYQGCSIDDRWKDFQQFAYDYENMVGYGLPNRQIDKDILVKGNKIYGPDTTILVPQDINILLTNCKNARGTLPLGVTYTPNNTPPYLVRIRKHGKRVYIGRYHTPEEAFQAYKVAKEQHIKDMANLYQHELDPRAYDALMNWTISEDD